MIKYFLIFLLFIFIFNIFVYDTFAQGSSSLPLVETQCFRGQCSWGDFIRLIQKVIRFLLIIGYWIAALVSLIGAFMMMFGGYSKDLMSKGRTMMINAVVYYVLVLLAGVLFDLFLDFLKPKVFIG
jgi:hypothetical protein